jgi:hypothetical protein
MYFACRAFLALAFTCSSIFLLAIRAEAQIQFNPNQDLRNSPPAASCESAIAAKIQTDHDALAHFHNNTEAQQDWVGHTRVGGSGEYLLGTTVKSFRFDCIYDEHDKAITSASYEDYGVNYEELVPPQSQAQDCQEKVIAKIYAKDYGDSWDKPWTNPRSIVAKSKKNGDRIIYGDGVGTAPFRFKCTYRDGRLITFDYWYRGW